MHCFLSLPILGLITISLCCNFYLKSILYFPKVWTTSRVELWSCPKENECNSQIQIRWDYCLVYCTECDSVLTLSTHYIFVLLCFQVIHCSSVRVQTPPSFPALNRRKLKGYAHMWSEMQQWVLQANCLSKSINFHLNSKMLKKKIFIVQVWKHVMNVTVFVSLDKHIHSDIQQ